MKVAFLGIYDVRFPYGISNKEIEERFKKCKTYVDEKYNSQMDVVDVQLKDSFNCQKTDKKLADKGIRISTAIDNPWTLFDIFDNLDKSLGQQYVDNSKVELLLDINA